MTFISLLAPIYYNVKQYGAIGNGTNDDTSSIAAAIAAASAAGGGVVYFPAGTYLITSTLTISSNNIHLVGAGRGSIIETPPIFSASPMLWVQGPGGTANFRYGIRIADLLLMNNVASGVIGIQLDSTYYASIQEVHVEGVYATNIWLNGLGPNGVTGAFGAYTSIIDCHLGSISGGAGSGGIGILTNFHEHSVVYGGVINWFNVPGGIGAKVTNSACQFLHTAFDECDTALDFEFCLGNQVIGCDFDRGVTQFIHLNGAKNTHIKSCQFGSFVGSGSKNVIFAENSGNASNVVSDCIMLAGSGWTNFVSENSGIGSPPNSYIGNDVDTLLVVRQNGLLRANRGYNPVGPYTPPVVPSSGSVYTNGFGTDCTVSVSGGTVSSIAIGGVATGLAGGNFRVPATQTIAITYTAAPSWQWYGD